MFICGICLSYLFVIRWIFLAVVMGYDWRKISFVYFSFNKHPRLLHDYVEKLESIEKNLKEGCNDHTWAAGAGSIFKKIAFEKCSSEGDKQDVPKTFFKTLTQLQLPRTINIQFTSKSRNTIFSTIITRGDFMVIKCHLRYWRNTYVKQHGLTMYLLDVKLLKKKVPL